MRRSKVMEGINCFLATKFNNITISKLTISPQKSHCYFNSSPLLLCIHILRILIFSIADSQMIHLSLGEAPRKSRQYFPHCCRPQRMLPDCQTVQYIGIHVQTRHRETLTGRQLFGTQILQDILSMTGP